MEEELQGGKILAQPKGVTPLLNHQKGVDCRLGVI